MTSSAPSAATRTDRNASDPLGCRSWLAASALAAEPGATPGTGGDPRSPGQGPGLVGDPLFAIGVVVLVALVSIGLTLGYVRLTGSRGGSRLRLKAAHRACWDHRPIGKNCQDGRLGWRKFTFPPTSRAQSGCLPPSRIDPSTPRCPSPRRHGCSACTRTRFGRGATPAGCATTGSTRAATGATASGTSSASCRPRPAVRSASSRAPSPDGTATAVASLRRRRA